MLKTLGLVIILTTLVTAGLFHAFWRKDSARGGWPRHMLWSVGGALAIGLGLYFGSWMLVAAGCVTHWHGYRTGRRLNQR